MGVLCACGAGQREAAAADSIDGEGQKGDAMSEKLPNKLSALLRIAVEDAQAIEKTRGYVLAMDTWHLAAGGRRKCAVCMAGSVMAKHLGASRKDSLHPCDFPEYESLLLAINEMRVGSFHQAALCLGFDPRKKNAAPLNAARAVVYKTYDSRLDRAPWSTYLEAADILEKAGL